MPNIEDVARRAGVAASTVSHVINGTRFVSEETKAAVQKAIAATGYVPNILARSLARSRTNTIGLALSAVSNPHFMNLIYAIEAECIARNWLLVLADTRENPDHELESVRRLHQQRVDGLILATCGDQNAKSLGYLSEKNLPTVLVDRLVSPSFSQVGVENTEAMKQLVNHLFSLGHRQIAMIAGRPHVATTFERVNGYQQALMANGISLDDRLIHDGSDDAASFVQLLSLRPAPTSIIAGNNRSMIRLMQVLHMQNRRVPQDLAVVGFDDFEWADCFSPRLTVIAQPIEQIAKRAVSLLADRIENDDARPQTFRLEPKLVIRESCGSGQTPEPSSAKRSRSSSGIIMGQRKSDPVKGRKRSQAQSSQNRRDMQQLK
ncbi:MAG: LacI family DNA-binding transcriptional regulator [Verrucomicrobia bacterium]|nr:LacI family DNA-binding transcriptional regulator [Verrucomicrobiota bacterium]